MDWEAIGSVGEIIGALAVVVSLLYVAGQIRHNTKTSQDEAYRDIFGQTNINFHVMAEASNTDVILKGLIDYKGLEGKDKFRFGCLMSALITTAESSVISSSADLMIDDTLETYARYLGPRYCAYTGMLEWWEESKDHFDPRARDWLDAQFQKANVESDIWGIK